MISLCFGNITSSYITSYFCDKKYRAIARQLPVDAKIDSLMYERNFLSTCLLVYVVRLFIHWMNWREMHQFMTSSRSRSLCHCKIDFCSLQILLFFPSMKEPKKSKFLDVAFLRGQFYTRFVMLRCFV